MGTTTEGAAGATLTIRLDAPVEFARGKYEALALMEPSAGQTLQAEQALGAGVNAETLRRRDVKLVAIVSGWPESAVGQLPISRLNEAADFLLEFTTRGLPEGDDAPPVPDEAEYTITLATPVTLLREERDTLALREPTAQQIMQAEGHMRKGVTAASLRLRDIHLVAAVAGWPVPAVQALPISRLNEAATYLLGFSMRGRRTGAT